MILVLDVGNTNIVLGIYDNDELIEEWRLSTDDKRTADEFGIEVTQLFNQKHIDIKQITGVIISSVVPNIMYSLERMVNKYFDVDPMIIGPGIKTGINVKYDNPKEVGADRIVNAVAAHQLYRKNLIIIDFGTATTYCIVTKDGDYLGGIISPGIKVSSDALFERAAKLPRVELVKPKDIICKNTVKSMQAGIVYGYIGQVDYIVNKVKKEMNKLGYDDILVVATGGFASIMHRECNNINVVNPFLTLQGLNMIYKKNIK